MTVRVLSITAAMSIAFIAVTACESSDRPSELSMENVKPCDLISRSELSDMRVKAKPQPLAIAEGINMEGRSCRYFDLNTDSIVIGAVTNQGVNWMGGAEKSAKAREVEKVRGFRTIKEERKDSSNGPHDTCTLWLDVASGQSLKVEVGENQKDDPPTCDTAREFAEAAMKTLVK